MDNSTHFQMTVVPGSSDIDQLDHVNNIAYLRWVQEVAEKHWMSKAPSELNRKYYWVVVSHEIHYKKPCFFGDKLTVKTMVPDDISGARWGRRVWIYRMEVLAVEAFTVWCLIDRRSNKPTRIKDEVKRVFFDTNIQNE